MTENRGLFFRPLYCKRARLVYKYFHVKNRLMYCAAYEKNNLKTIC